MKCLRSCRFTLARFSTSSERLRLDRRNLAVLTAMFLSVVCWAQNPQEPPNTDSPPNPAQGETKLNTVTLTAGTKLPLVLTHPIQSRVLRRGDDVYAQVTAPVNSGNQVVIPPGTFVQGTLDRLDHKGGRGELRLQSMAITFPDGYVAPIPGPITLETSEGYAIKDPGQRRAAGAFVLPAAGAGLGAIIGHSVGTAPSTTTTNFPPGCAGGPPFCTTTTTPVFGTKGRDTIIGAGIGGAVGAFDSMALLFGSHNFFIDVGAPVELTLQQPITLQQNEVAKAVKQSEEHPVAEQPAAPRPLPPPPPDTPVDHGTCWTPGTPGTPPQTIPGPPNADGTPGPPTIIPGAPGVPPTPYPCP